MNTFPLALIQDYAIVSVAYNKNKSGSQFMFSTDIIKCTVLEMWHYRKNTSCTYMQMNTGQ